MSNRDLKSEAKWKKEKYERISVDIDKKLGLELKEKIREDCKYSSIADWVTCNAKKYLNKS